MVGHISPPPFFLPELLRISFEFRWLGLGYVGLLDSLAVTLIILVLLELPTHWTIRNYQIPISMLDRT